MENPIKMDDLGENPYFWKHPNIEFSSFSLVQSPIVNIHWCVMVFGDSPKVF